MPLCEGEGAALKRGATLRRIALTVYCNICYKKMFQVIQGLLGKSGFSDLRSPMDSIPQAHPGHINRVGVPTSDLAEFRMTIESTFGAPC